MKNIKLLLLAVLLLIVLTSRCYVVKATIEEEILVEKEVDPSTTTTVSSSTTATTHNNRQAETKPKETPIPQQPPKEETTQESPKRMNRRQTLNHEDIYERRALRNLMREMRNYQFGNDLVFDPFPGMGSHFMNSFLTRPSSAFFGNSLFDTSFGDFLNFENSIDMMRRRMNSMLFGNSFLPSSLFDNHHPLFEKFKRSPQQPQQPTTSEPIVPEQSKGPEPQQPTVAELNQQQAKKKREPITSVIKSEENREGKLEYALDVSNIPRDVFEKKDIEIKIHETSNGDLISIRAEKKTENGHYEFSKSFKFPKNSVDFERVKASLSDEGTLSVRIPRVDIPEKVKSITVE